MITKRSFFRGLFAAPAIVSAASLMPIRVAASDEEIGIAEMAALIDARLDDGVVTLSRRRAQELADIIMGRPIVQLRRFDAPYVRSKPFDRVITEELDFSGVYYFEGGGCHFNGNEKLMAKAKSDQLSRYEKFTAEMNAGRYGPKA